MEGSSKLGLGLNETSRDVAPGYSGTGTDFLSITSDAGRIIFAVVSRRLRMAINPHFTMSWAIPLGLLTQEKAWLSYASWRMLHQHFGKLVGGRMGRRSFRLRARAKILLLSRWDARLLLMQTGGGTCKTVPPKRGVTSFLATVVCQTDRRCNRHNKRITPRLALLFVSECLTPLQVRHTIRSYGYWFG